MTKVRVFDQICGSGKTEMIMQKMLYEDRPILYITPLLSECHRISGTMKEMEGQEEIWAKDEDGEFVTDPTHSLAVKNFKHPMTRANHGTKLKDLLRLVLERHNIVSTHVLFKMLTKDVLEAIRLAGYLLICDEAISVYEQYELEGQSEEKTGTNIIAIKENGFISVEKDGKLVWDYSKYPKPEGTYYEECASLCDMGQLYIVNNKTVFMELSVDTVQSFDEIWFATYMFEYSYLCSFLKGHQIGYEIEYGSAIPSDYKDLIKICEEGKINNIGNGYNSLSVGDLKIKSVKDTLSRNLFNFFTNRTDSAVDQRIWTTVLKSKPAIGGARYKSQFVPIGTKATNDYIKATAAAYLYNGFSNPMLLHLINKREVDFDQDMWGLSEMIQWLWRTQIRCKKPITVYIPSSRMRNLFKRWLNDEFTINSEV